MKKIYMIHGWGGSPEDNWFPWLKEELEKKNFGVKVFDMPNTENPLIEDWVGFLQENIKDVDESTYFVGHSIGCQTILRFLEKLHKHKKIGGCIFIAPWFNSINLGKEEMEIAHPWLNTKVDFSRVLDHCDNFLAIFSDNDPYVPFSEIDFFKEKLNTKTVIEKDRGHFEEEKEPVILREVLRFL